MDDEVDDDDDTHQKLLSANNFLSLPLSFTFARGDGLCCSSLLYHQLLLRKEKCVNK
jgi:hypothetical protein